MGRYANLFLAIANGRKQSIYFFPLQTALLRMCFRQSEEHKNRKMKAVSHSFAFRSVFSSVFSQPPSLSVCHVTLPSQYKNALNS